MLGYLKFKSYRMFEGESVLSAYADCRSKRLLSNAAEHDGRTVLKSLAVYGTNNSGKTSLIDLFAIVKSIFDDQWASLRFGESVFGDAMDTEIEVEFNNNDGLGWIRYGFVYSRSHGFVKENLAHAHYYESGKVRLETVLSIDRGHDEFALFGKDARETLSIVSASRPLLFMISPAFPQYSRLKAYIDCFHRFADSLLIVRMYDVRMEGTIEALKSQDEEAKRFILDFVKLADVSVASFGYEKGSESGLDEEEMSLYRNHDFHRLYTEYSKHGAIHRVPSVLFDSSGTKRIEALASYLYYALKRGQTLVVDELDNGLHYILTRTIVNCFNLLSNENAQLIFTAHDFTVLDRPTILRKDQLYFTERQGEESSLVCAKQYSVASGGPRGEDNLLRSYQLGELGRMPLPDFTDLFSGIHGQKA